MKLIPYRETGAMAPVSRDTEAIAPYRGIAWRARLHALTDDATLALTSDVAQVILALHVAIAKYLADHPHRRLPCALLHATMEMYGTLRDATDAEQACRLAITVGEVQQCDQLALTPDVCRVLGEAERFIRYSNV